MPKENRVNITFNDKKTSVKKILAALENGEVGRPIKAEKREKK